MIQSGLAGSFPRGAVGRVIHIRGSFCRCLYSCFMRAMGLASVSHGSVGGRVIFRKLRRIRQRLGGRGYGFTFTCLKRCKG